MIEKILIGFLSQRAGMPVGAELPPGGLSLPSLVVQKTGGGGADRVRHAVVAVQSYGRTMQEAAETNELVIRLMDEAVALPEIGGIRLNSDYNYTDTASRRYRYQAVFEITYY